MTEAADGETTNEPEPTEQVKPADAAAHDPDPATEVMKSTDPDHEPATEIMAASAATVAAEVAPGARTPVHGSVRLRCGGDDEDRHSA